MGITGLIPFLEKASRRVNVDEFSGCTVAIDSYCWLHKGAFACAERLVRGEETDVHIKYCLKYVTMLLSKNIKPIMVFDGRHLPAKALTEAKRRESRNTSKKRAAELLSLGQTEEARSYMRRSVDITHAMALALMRELRARNVDCVVAPYEADSQLAFLNTRNLAHLVITEDSDLLLFGCTKVLFKMDLEGHGTLIESAKLPLAMRCPVERYSLERFRWMCVMSGCDYLPSLPGIGLAKARQFLTASLDNDIANALKKLPSFFNKANLTVTDEYRENFLKAEATFKHQYVYDTIQRQMLRLTEPDDDDTEKALCTNAGELLPPDVAFQLALGNLDPFTMKPVDDWDPDRRSDQRSTIKTDGWKDKGVAPHPSIWNPDYKQYLTDDRPWQKKPRPKAELIIAPPKTRAVKKVVNLVSRYVAETQDESLTIESLSNMYCVEPAMKKQKMESYTQDSQQEIDSHDRGMLGDNLETDLTQKIKEKSPTQKIKEKSPILENKERSFLKCVKNGNIAALKRLSRFPRTVLDDNVVESKFFSQPSKEETITVEESPKKNKFEIDSQCTEIPDSQQIETKYSLKSEHRLRNPFKITPDRSNHTAKTEINTECTEITDLQKFAFTSKKHNEQYKNPLKVTPKEQSTETDIDSQCIEIPDSQEALSSSQKENSPRNSPVKCPRSSESPILKPSPRSKNPFRARPLVELTSSVDLTLSDVSVVENTYPLERLVTPVDSQTSFGSVTQPEEPAWLNNQTYKPKPISSSQPQPLKNGLKKSTCKVPGLKRTASLPSNQPTLLSKFGFQKRPVMKK